MAGGWRDPFAGVPQLDAKTTYEEAETGEVAILDVREREEWELGHIEGAEWVPLNEIPRNMQRIDPGKKWICVCLSGVRSNYAAAYLRQLGIDASNMEGGMLAWQAGRLPLTPPGIVATH